MEKSGQLPYWRPDTTRRRTKRNFANLLFTIGWISTLLFNLTWIACRLWLWNSIESLPDVAKVQQCAINNFHADLSFLHSVSPISSDEFLSRHDRLAHALVATGVDAFILEPGYTFQYYGNISQMDWEPWEPEERPFLMLIMPEILSSGEIVAKTAFLAPHFEEGRVRMLGIPSREKELDIVIWEEHWDPYLTLMNSRLFKGKSGSKQRPKLMMDEEIRDFIARGLAETGFETVGLLPEVELVKQIKSPAEIELLRAVNTGTVVAVRAMRPCLVSGLTEDNVRDILDATLMSIGFGLFFDIVLFEDHGALPHGGFVTGGKKLNEESMVVIDVGYVLPVSANLEMQLTNGYRAHYLGYSSDICRSFFIDPSQTSTSRVWNSIEVVLQSVGLSKPNLSSISGNTELHAEKLKVWDIVYDAQTAAAQAFKSGNTAASVDIAARGVIEEAGYGYGFTHRLGHGIGVKGKPPSATGSPAFAHSFFSAHESPYLNKWNTKVLLQPGMTFTNEPGIYLEGRFGIRHEDIYLVKEEGDAELLTGRRAVGPYDP
jgi:Xaa-Pro aminopeptidase